KLRVKELEQQVQQAPAPSGCSKDIDCKGERICVAAQCVDPPLPPANASPNDTAPAPTPLQSDPEALDSLPPPHSQDPAPPTPQDTPGHFPPAQDGPSGN